MAFKDYARAILSGGLPAVLETPNAAPAAQGDVAANAPKGRVEQTPPEPTKKDVEPFLQRTVKITDDFELNMVATLIAGAAILGLVVAVIGRMSR